MKDARDLQVLEEVFQVRRLFFGFSLLALCSATFAAGVVIDPKMTTGPLGLGDLQPEVLSGLPVIDIQIPLPAEVESALPKISGDPEGGFNYSTPVARPFGDIPGLGALTSIDADFEIPGLDGLPIKSRAVRINNTVNMPGFDGLPLGFGHQ